MWLLLVLFESVSKNANRSVWAVSELQSDLWLKRHLIQILIYVISGFEFASSDVRWNSHSTPELHSVLYPHLLKLVNAECRNGPLGPSGIWFTIRRLSFKITQRRSVPPVGFPRPVLFRHRLPVNVWHVLLLPLKRNLWAFICKDVDFVLISICSMGFYRRSCSVCVREAKTYNSD